MKKMLAVLAMAAGCFSATPPVGITGAPGKPDDSSAKIQVFATVYHDNLKDDVTLQISTSSADAVSFSATIAYESVDGAITSVALPTVPRSATWPITYTGVSLKNFKRLISATVHEIPPSVVFAFSF